MNATLDLPVRVRIRGRRRMRLRAALVRLVPEAAKRGRLAHDRLLSWIARPVWIEGRSGRTRVFVHRPGQSYDPATGELSLDEVAVITTR